MTEGAAVEREKWSIWCYTSVKITLILCPISVCFYKHLAQIVVYFISLCPDPLILYTRITRLLGTVTLWTFYLFIYSNLKLIDIFHHSVRFMRRCAIQWDKYLSHPCIIHNVSELSSLYASEDNFHIAKNFCGWGFRKLGILACFRQAS